jgi:hypothetical protein
LTLARAPVRITLRAWEFGLSTAAEAARIGVGLLDPGRGAPPPDFARHRSASHPDNGTAPDYGAPSGPDVETGTAVEPEVVLPETGYLAPEPGEVGPEPDVLDVAADTPAAPAATVDAPPAVPDELIPDHVDEEPVLVAEVAEEGAEEGAGPELTVDPPWDGYEQMTAADIRDRLAAASPVEAGAVELYERTHKNRSSVIEASERVQRR